MRDMASIAHGSKSVGLPRGVTVLSMAIGSWLLVAAAWFALSELFALVAAAL